MRIQYTDEMLELRKKFEPYEDGSHLKLDAPSEAKEAYEKYFAIIAELMSRE